MSSVKCELCPTECVLRDYEVGGCKVRVNRGGELFSLVYGRPCAVHVDPIEKKPFFHFYPATPVFSIATVGCVLACRFCQNWEISQALPEEEEFMDLPPEAVVREAKRWARVLSMWGALALGAIIQAVNEGLDQPLDEAIKNEAHLFAKLTETEDMREGVGAFLEKRRPKFQDK